MVLAPLALAGLLATAAPPDTDESVATTIAGEAEATPLQLLNALLTTPFPVDRLPDTFAGGEIEPWLDYADTDLASAIGGAAFVAPDADLDSDEFGGGFFITVYGTAEQAEAYVEATLEPDGAPSDQICVDVVDNVVVAAVVPPDGDETACEVAEVVTAHLESVAASAADATDRWAFDPGEFGPFQRLNALVDDTAGTELISYDDQRVTAAIGGVEIDVDDDNTITSVLVFRSEAEADAWLLDAPLSGEVLSRDESSEGDLSITVATDAGVGCATSRGTLVVLATADGGTATDDACAAVATGVDVVDALTPD